MIFGSTEANDRLLARMTNINTNHHHLVAGHELWHLHSHRFSSDLGVDLLHDIRSNGEIYLSGGLLQDHLTHDVHPAEKLLECWVVSSSLEHHHCKDLFIFLGGIVLELVYELIEGHLNLLSVSSAVRETEHLHLFGLHTHLALAFHQVCTS